MTSILIFPCESDVGKNLPISYSWFHGDFLDNMVKAHIKREESGLKVTGALGRNCGTSGMSI